MAPGLSLLKKLGLDVKKVKNPYLKTLMHTVFVFLF